MKTTYQVLGTVTKEGSIAGNSVTVGQELKDEYALNDKETRTIQLQADGNWTVKVHNYNKEGKLVTTNVVEVTRDITKPEVKTAVAESTSASTASVQMNVVDVTSGLATNNNAYQFCKNTEIIMNQGSNAFEYTNLSQTENFEIFIIKVKDRAGNEIETNPTEIRYYLVDRSNVGDYVAYDAGVWMAGELTGGTWTSRDGEGGVSNCSFGGYSAGTNKGTSIGTNNAWITTSDKFSKNGWRVFRNEGSGREGATVLISAGCPVLAREKGTSKMNLETFGNALDDFCSLTFKNGPFVDFAKSVTYDEIRRIDQSSDIRNCRSWYWTSTWVYNSTSSGTSAYVWAVNDNGGKTQLSKRICGVRPVVKLISGCQTNTICDVEFLGNLSWKLK